jgi:hypothetical protein
MATAILIQQIFHVFEKFYMASLVTGNSDALYIFFNGTLYYFGYTAVVPEVNDFCTLALQDAAHDVDGRIVAIEQRGSGYNSNFLLGSETHVANTFWNDW